MEYALLSNTVARWRCTFIAAVAVYCCMTAAGDGPVQTAQVAQTGDGITREHYAWEHQCGYLNGPRCEAMGSGLGPLDADFNCYTMDGRCIRSSDDMIVTYFGSDYGCLAYSGDEGPSAFLPPLSRSTGYGQPVGGVIVRGLPWKGGESGCVFAYSDTDIYKVWRNEAKSNRWWFKRVVGKGHLEVPGRKVWMGQMTRDGKMIFFTATGFYELQENGAEARFVPMLELDKIQDRLPKRNGKGVRPTLGIVDNAGTFYLGYYFEHVAPAIQRVSSDGSRVDDYADSLLGRKTGPAAQKGQDGLAMEAGWHCGPWISSTKAIGQWFPPGVFIGHAHDEGTIRRFLDGRVSTLYKDGEWREAASVEGCQIGAVTMFSLGANGQALGGASNMLLGHSGEGLYLFKGIDLGKPTVSPQKGKE